jgi:hypothetical protein
MALVECPEDEKLNQPAARRKPSKWFMLLGLVSIIVGLLLVKNNAALPITRETYLTDKEEILSTAKEVGFKVAELKDEGNLEQAKEYEKLQQEFVRLSTDPNALLNRHNDKNERLFWWRIGGICLAVLGVVLMIVPFVRLRLR